jgi:hypothetical protein
VTGELVAPDGGLPLILAARLLGQYRWVERRLFHILGEWVINEPIPLLQRWFDVQSRYHGWHADLWGQRLPALDGVDPESLTVPPSPDVERFLVALAGGARRDGAEPLEDSSGGGGLLHLAGLSRVVLPRLITGYAEHLRRVAPASDLAVARTLRFVLQDEKEAWQEAEKLVQRHLHRPHDVAVVTAFQGQLESFVVSAGPGIVPWPVPAPRGEGHSQEGASPPR